MYSFADLYLKFCCTSMCSRIFQQLFWICKLKKKTCFISVFEVILGIISSNGRWKVKNLKVGLEDKRIVLPISDFVNRHGVKVQMLDLCSAVINRAAPHLKKDRRKDTMARWIPIKASQFRFSRRARFYFHRSRRHFFYGGTCTFLACRSFFNIFSFPRHLWKVSRVWHIGAAKKRDT